MSVRRCRAAGVVGRLAQTLIVAAVPALAGHAGEPVDFARDVAPILQRSCLSCHQPGNAKGGVSLATVADLVADEFYVAPSRPEESYLLDLVRPEADGEPPVMPKAGNPLTAEEVDLIRRWIAEGATWPGDLVLHEPSKAGDDWWALQPLAEVEPPRTEGLPDAWARNPIDAFLFARMAEQGLSPSPTADRRTLIRRVTYDLTGLPPTPSEVEAFLADEAPDAYERLVDRLLASPRYGERWGRHWLDVVRFGESNGYERNVIIDNAWPFRDYVIRSFNEDRPFDRLVLEHLAGDVLGPGDPEVEVGTTFLVCGPYDNVGNQDAAQAAQIRADAIDEMIRATSETFLGLTIGCARCHDHKFDPIRQADYYALNATFAGVHHGSRVLATDEQRRQREDALRPLRDEQERLTRERGELEESVLARGRAAAPDYEARWVRPPVDRHGTEETFTPVEARYVRLTVASRDDTPDAATGFHIDEFEVWTAGDDPRNVALSAEGGSAEGKSRVAEDFAGAYDVDLTIDGRFGAHWIAAGPELTIALARPSRIDRVVFSNDRKRELAPTSFVGEYRVEVSPDGDCWTEVASSADRQPPTDAHRRRRLLDAELTEAESHQLSALKSELRQVQEQIEAVPELPSWWVGQFRDAPGPFSTFVGGDPQKKGDEVVPASPSVLDATTPSYRLAAEAPESGRRLALARWIVDPANPLTPRVLANRLWHYHFGTGIVNTPSDFGYMGGRPTHPELLDWLAREVHAQGWRLKPLHRRIVTSQAYRQASAYRFEAAAVDADSRFLWRFPPRRLEAEEIRDAMLAVAGVLESDMGGPGFRLYRYLEDNVATYVPLAEHGPETYRRAVYHQNARAAPVDLLGEFDCPDPAFAEPRRAATTSPLQALTLMNHPFTLDMAEALADRLGREACDPADQVRRAFLLSYARPPGPEELDDAAALVRAHGLRAFCRALFNSNEFLFLD